MPAPNPDQVPLLTGVSLPRVTFVLGKGGVGRSSVAAALGLLLSERGQRVLVLEWAVDDVIGPWFGAPPAGPTPVEVAPGLSVANFALDEALRAYFVDHLHLGFVYRSTIRARPVAQLLEVASGLAEMFFLGELWWLTTLAEREAGLRFDRIIVDAPATGHAASLLDVPATLLKMGAGGLLETETRRVADMLADPVRTGALVVSLPEPLVVDETLELLPRVSARLGRAPLALLVNRSASEIVDVERPPWLDGLGGQLSDGSRGALAAVEEELRARLGSERRLRQESSCPVASIGELLVRTPLGIVPALAAALGRAP
jgi:anion-transporting  ArsA/GET3 family ATPase